MSEINSNELVNTNQPEKFSVTRRRSGHWPFLIFFAVLGLILAAILDNLPILLFMAAGLLIVLRFAYRTFVRPYLRAQRMRRTRDARALREASRG